MKNIIIEKNKKLRALLAELWYFRAAFLFLSLRDVLVVYKQTVIGFIWIVLRPLLMLSIFTIVFGQVAGLASISKTPYILVVLVGILVWQFFCDVFASGSNAFIAYEPFITKVYFPRIFIPGSRLLCSTIDFFMTILLFWGLMLFWYDKELTLRAFYVVPLFLWLMVFSFSVTLLFASLIVRYRDFRHVVGFLLQLGIYISPVGYRSFIFSRKWHMILSINPLVGIIDGMRWAFLYDHYMLSSVCISLVSTGAIFFISLFYFKRAEKFFADVI